VRSSTAEVGWQTKAVLAAGRASMPYFAQEKEMTAMNEKTKMAEAPTVDEVRHHTTTLK
jgi:hypothetical protein